MNDLDKLKQEKLKELQQNLNQQPQENIQQETQIQDQINQLEILIKKYLTRDALLRYGNIKTASPEKAIQTLTVLAQLIQFKKENEKISDQELKEVLIKIQEPKKEFNIRK
ncbi:hypothetical protein CL617_03990 [archaeon]|nr:hypothetical protein [archaeon]|tara:strand:- start:2457 stop:2789 length:333 start_codon:yes stop_codon:yes gene_type:complete